MPQTHPTAARRFGLPSKLDSNQAVPMGDKSPKAKDKAKKQDTATKDQKKANASNKASVQMAKKGK
jgi:hypothetical protein